MAKILSQLLHSLLHLLYIFVYNGRLVLQPFRQLNSDLNIGIKDYVKPLLLLLLAVTAYNHVLCQQHPHLNVYFAVAHEVYDYIEHKNISIIFHSLSVLLALI
jgi:hypothetical protein